MGTPLRKLGPCAIEWKNTLICGDGINSVHGDTTFASADDTAPYYRDELGSQPSDEIYTGKSCEVTVPLTGTQLSILALVTTGSSGTGTTGDQVVVRNPVGQSMYDRAGLLVIKPIVEGGVASTNPKEWVTVFMAAPRADTSIVYNVSGQRVYTVHFRGFPVAADAVGMKKGWLFKIGSI